MDHLIDPFEQDADQDLQIPFNRLCPVTGLPVPEDADHITVSFTDEGGRQRRLHLAGADEQSLHEIRQYPDYYGQLALDDRLAEDTKQFRRPKKRQPPTTGPG